MTIGKSECADNITDDILTSAPIYLVAEEHHLSSGYDK